jgi:hypothetical protein
MKPWFNNFLLNFILSNTNIVLKYNKYFKYTHKPLLAFTVAFKGKANYIMF